MSYEALLIKDLLERVISDPSAAFKWRNLAKALNPVLDGKLRTFVIERIRSEVEEVGLPGFLRATFLFTFTEDSEYLAEASRILQGLTPFNADRLSTFLVYGWWKFALFGSSNRHEFIARLRIASIPELVYFFGENITRRLAKHISSRNISQVRKVVILSPLLSIIEHAGTSLALHHAQMLTEGGMAVKIFATQESQIPDMEQYLGGGENVHGQFAPDLDNWRQFPFKGFQYTICNRQYSLMTRFGEIMRQIGQFDPDLILFVGFFSPLLSTLWESRPVMGLSIHSLPPIGPIDLWLAAEAPGNKTSDYPWLPYFRPPELFPYPYRIKLKPQFQRIARKSLGLKEDAVVIITVGYNLWHIFKENWLSSLFAFLGEHRNVEWLLVGTGKDLASGVPADISAQVHCLGHHPDVRSICRCADIYVNPPQMGGGFSVAIAMAEGLPIVTLRDSDGGDKVGPVAVSSLKAYFERLELLIMDQTKRRKEGQEMQALFNQTLALERGRESLFEACNLTLEIYNRRIKKVLS